MHTEQGRSLLADAIKLTELGLRVFPVSAKRKPLVRRFHGDRAYPVAVLRRFAWDEAAFIGLALSKDQIALDIDIKEGKLGDEHLAQLEALLGALPPAIVRRTPSGGWHLLFHRGDVPHDVPLASHCVLPDGSYAHIDIVHRGNRYLVVYDVELWLAHPSPLSGLSQAWIPGLTKGPRNPVSHETKRLEIRETLGTLDVLVAEVADAKEFRNESLNRNLYFALIQGNSDPSVIGLFREAALHNGLEPEEVERTIDSALQAASAKQTFAVRWCRAVAEHPLLNGARRRNTCMAIATTFARYYVWKPGEPLVGMSVRELSEACGISVKTACERLSDFRTAGLLTMGRKGSYSMARQYKLVLPSATSQMGNTPPPPPLGGVLPQGELFPTLNGVDLLRAELLSCAAFIRLGGGPVFSPTCVDVLITLLAGPDKRAGLARRARRSWGAVDRAVLILHSAGIVDFDASTGEACLLTDSLVQAVDDWATAMGVIIRPEIRQLIHEKEREEYRARREESARPVADGQRSDD